MRKFQTLDQVEINSSTGLIHFQGQDTHLAMSREGEYVAISASYGPFEIALRPRLQELIRTLKNLHPVEGLQTTRQIGTSQAQLSVGLNTSGALILRPTIIADASGFMCLNLELTPETRQKLFSWLEIA